MGGGGGASGAISFPPHIDNGHKIIMYGLNVDSYPETFLNGSVFEEMDRILYPLNNPYNGFAFTDPGIVLAGTQSIFNTLKDRIVASVPSADYESFLDYVKSRAVDGDIVKDVHASDFTDGIRGDLGSDLQSFSDNFDTDIDEYSSLGQAITQVVNSLNGVGVLKNTDFASVIVTTISSTTQLVNTALSAATDAMGSIDIQALLDDYVDRIETQKANQVREFNSSMADINAVNSTAFVFGNALINSAVLKSIAAYRAETEQKIFDSVLSAYIAGTGGFLQGGLGAIQGDIRGREQLLSDAMKSVVSMSLDKTDYRKAMAGLYGQVFQGELESTLRAELTNAQTYNRTILEASKDFQNQYQWRFSVEDSLVKLQAEINRLKVVATAEYEDRVIDIDYKHATWGLDVFEKGANILAAPSGMAALVPKGPSKGQSALSGAVAGAGAGAAIGGPVGAGVGAVVGGLAGLLS